MKIIIAPDSFKDALDAFEVAAAIERGLHLVLPDAECLKIPLADGGEGTAEVLSLQLGAEQISLSVTGPLFNPVTAGYGWLPSTQTAFMDMASSSGLQWLSPAQRDPLQTTTFGLGELIDDAIQRGARHILLGIGGSATNDGGIGMAAALGYQFLDSKGKALRPNGSALNAIHTIIPPNRTDLREVEIKVLCDVNNPLFGPNGAACIFAPQKGADPATVERLDKGLKNLSDRLDQQLQQSVSDLPGGGAAGGLGAGLVAFLQASLQPGIATVLDFLKVEEAIKDADWIITGEGKLDGQTAAGKLISGICALAKPHSVPVIALCGTLSASPLEIKQLGLRAAFSILNAPMTLQEALQQTALLLETQSAQIAGLL